jgi:hypothetical protein
MCADYTIDLCGALISDGTRSTLVPMAQWLPPSANGNGDASALFKDTASPEMHANYAVYLCSTVCELMADRVAFVELGEANGCDEHMFETRWLDLWHELQNWQQDRPSQMQAIQIIASEPFPQVLFAHWPAISSNQLYHTACILLLSSMPADTIAKPGQQWSAIWHAKMVCGISLTNPHSGCLNNAIQPLWVAGRLLSHESEHVLVAKLIRSIESMTGWATSWRISDLETEWGHKVR